MIKIDAIVREEKMEDVKDGLKNVGVNGMTISQVVGCGTRLGYRHKVRGSEVDVNVIPKVKFEIVVSDQEWADLVLSVLRTVAYTGHHGDGKIFVYELMDAVRIRTGEQGVAAIRSKEQNEAAADKIEKSQE